MTGIGIVSAAGGECLAGDGELRCIVSKDLEADAISSP
jgi:hypothetical protein